jgi:hypothetical protein
MGAVRSVSGGGGDVVALGSFGSVVLSSVNDGWVSDRRRSGRAWRVWVYWSIMSGEGTSMSVGREGADEWLLGVSGSLAVVVRSIVGLLVDSLGVVDGPVRSSGMY